MATATVNSTQTLVAGSSAQPSSTAGLVVRGVTLNFASGDANVNFSGNTTTGLGTIYAASGMALGSGTQTLAASNTAGTTSPIYPITKGVTFVPSTTTGCTMSAIVISSQ